MPRHRSPITRLPALCLLALVLALSFGRTGHAGPAANAGAYRVEITTQPAVVPVGPAKVTFLVTRDGRPAPDLRIQTIVKMPTMDMGEREGPALPVPGHPGSYTAPASFSMAGEYVARFRLQTPDGEIPGEITLRTGEDTTPAAAAPAGPDLGRFIPGAALLAGLAFVLYRVRRTGQRVAWRAVFNRTVAGGLLLIGLMTVAAVYAVRHFRRPGAMTPIEAQAMEMSTPAPPGTAAVELATVSREAIESTVRYTGQAAAYAVQDVAPRVRGAILWMPFYPGDRVRQGQVLARLDTSELAPLVAERRSALAAAEKQVEISRAEFRQAEAGVDRAEAEAGITEAEGAEARSGEKRARAFQAEMEGELRLAQAAVREMDGDAEAAREERSGAQSDVEAAQSQQEEASAGLAAAKADQQYWAVQIGRTRALLTQGAVSDEEVRRETAQAANAEARLRQAESRLQQSRSTLRSAQARVRRAEALLTGAAARTAQARERVETAKARIEQARAEVEAAAARAHQAEHDLKLHHSHIRETQEAAEAARHRVEQARLVGAQVRASLGGATRAEAFTTLYSAMDGVVTERPVAPGNLVEAGRVVLRVAQLNPIRVQANIAAVDLASVRVGSPVRLLEPGTDRVLERARLSALVPAVDPAARTAVAEALVGNPTSRWVPGQYVVLEITTGRRTGALVVPPAALTWRSTEERRGDTTPRAFVWVAEGSDGESLTVRRVAVRVGMRNSRRVEILAGLTDGQRVVIRGQDSLSEGDAVVEVPSEPAEVSSAAAPGEAARAVAEPGSARPGSWATPGFPAAAGMAAMGGARPMGSGMSSQGAGMAPEALALMPAAGGMRPGAAGMGRTMRGAGMPLAGMRAMGSGSMGSLTPPEAPSTARSAPARRFGGSTGFTPFGSPPAGAGMAGMGGR